MFSCSRKLIFSYKAFIAEAIALEVEGSRVQSRDILPTGVAVLLGDCLDTWDLTGDYLDVFSIRSGEFPKSNCSSYSVFIFRA